MYDGPMETGEYIWVNVWCMLDWIIGLCHQSAEIYFLGRQFTHLAVQLVSAQNETLLWLVGMNYENSNPLQGLTSGGTIW